MPGPEADVERWVAPVSMFPASVRAEVSRRREQVLVRAVGTVLDLDDPAVIRRFVPIERTALRIDDRPRLPTTDRFDTVVATGVLSAFADLGAIVAALADLVADDGALLFVEPIGRPGWAATMGQTVAGLQHRRAPWRSLHLDRDVPAAVRATGLVICDLDRGELPAEPRPLRHWVTGRAVRIT